MTGCSRLLTGLAGEASENINDMLKKIPPNSFSEFSYERTGLVTSANIEAKGVTKTADTLTMKEVKIKLKYGAQNVSIIMKDVVREINGPQKPEMTQ